MKLLRVPLWLCVALACLVVAYLAFGLFVAPGLIRGAVLRAASEHFTRPATLERVTVNPLNLSLHLRRFGLDRADGRRVLGFDGLYIRFDPLGSMFERGITLARLRLDQPLVSVEVRANGALDLAELLRVDTTKTVDTTGVSLHVHDLEITGGTLSFADRGREPVLELGAHPVDLRLSDFRTRRGANNDFDLHASTAAAESLHWQGSFALAPFHSEGSLDLKNLQAATLTRLLGSALRFSMPRGSADFGTRYRVDARSTPTAMSLEGLHAELRDWTLANRKADTTVIVLQEAHVREGRADLTHTSMTIDSVGVVGGTATLWMERSGHLNLEAWAPPADPAAPKWMLRIARLGVRGVAVRYEDRRVGPPAVFELNDVAAMLHDFSTEPGAQAALRAQARLFDAGSCTLEGNLDPLKPSADLQLGIERFPLISLQPYMDHVNRVVILGGSAFGRGRLRFNALGAKGPLIRYEGSAEIRDFHSMDKLLRQDLLRWKSLRLAQLRYETAPTRVETKQVDVEGGFARVVVGPDRVPNLATVGLPPDSAAGYSSMKADSTDTLVAKIDLVNVRNSSAYFSDLSLTPSFSTGIEELNGTIRGLSSLQATGGEISLDGQVDRYAPVSVRGAFNPLSPGGHTDVSTSFQHIELTTFTPYSGKFMGYRITRGKLSLGLHYVVDGRQLVGENKILMEQLTLGEKVDSPDATHLPVRFAIALLKDRNGNIDLDLPVKGSLDDPKFSVGRILLKVLVNLVTKAVTSPFKALGALLGGGESEELGVVEFAAGRSAIDTLQVGKVQKLAKALSERPQLRLDIPAVYDALADSVALARAQFDRRFQAALEADRAKHGKQLPAPGTSATAEERARIVEKLYVSDFGTAPPPAARSAGRKPKRGEVDSLAVAAEAARVSGMEQRLVAATRLDPAALPQLGRDRALAVKDRVVAFGADPGQIFIVDAREPTRTPGTEVRIEMALDGR